MPWLRLARLVTIAVVLGLAIANLTWAVADLHFNDLHSYRAAALRIRDGEQLYGGDVTPFNKYYYAPWFAFAFIPLSYLPWEVLALGWTSFTVACSVVAVGPLVKHGSHAALAAAVLLGSILVALSISGNVHAPMLAMLVMLLRTRWAPVAIGVAASLKATPILLTLAYLARGEWRAAVLAVLVGSALWAPILLFDVAPITFESGGAALDMTVWLALAATGAVAAIVIALRSPHHRWLAASAAVFLATPRLYVYDVTILVAAIPWLRDANHGNPTRVRTQRRIGHDG